MEENAQQYIDMAIELGINYGLDFIFAVLKIYSCISP